jgi:hypothetical protein
MQGVGSERELPGCAVLARYQQVPLAMTNHQAK